jgi:hypothetical protein
MAPHEGDVQEEACSTAGSEASSQEGVAECLGSQRGAGKAGSIASTYWRPERRDRGGLSLLDER